MGHSLEIPNNTDQSLELIKNPPDGVTKIIIDLDKVKIDPAQLVNSPKHIQHFEIIQYGQTHIMSRRTFFGVISYEKGLIQVSLQHLEQQIKRHPNDPYALTYMAKYQYEQKQFEIAVELINKVLILKPGLSIALALLISINLSKGNFSQTITIFFQLQQELTPQFFKEFVQNSFSNVIYQCIVPQPLANSFDTQALDKQLANESCSICCDGFSCKDEIVLVTPDGDAITRARFQPYHRLCLFGWFSVPQHCKDPNTNSSIAMISRFSA